MSINKENFLEKIMEAALKHDPHLTKRQIYNRIHNEERSVVYKVYQRLKDKEQEKKDDV